MAVAKRINHIGLAVPNIESFLAAHSILYGSFERGQLITNETQGVREMFISDGHHVIELLEPLRTGSPLDTFLAKHPAGGLIHVALDVENLEVAIEEVERQDGRLISGPMPDIAFGYRRIAFVYLGGQITELIEMPKPAAA
jgi:methylmalonyl-CoA/ethylmalonyl-CoA epimerase